MLKKEPFFIVSPDDEVLCSPPYDINDKEFDDMRKDMEKEVENMIDNSTRRGFLQMMVSSCIVSGLLPSNAVAEEGAVVLLLIYASPGTSVSHQTYVTLLRYVPRGISVVG
ncbi:MAG: hypothetical protein LBU65_16320 [Planctomycetaceae bacterium]|jgi:hypothetical protein|nr:hypothetical protein [Planctomycetaceae bacterium]